MKPKRREEAKGGGVSGVPFAGHARQACLPPGASAAASLDCFLAGQGAALSVFFSELLTQINALQQKVQVCSNTLSLCFSAKVFHCQQNWIIIKWSTCSKQKIHERMIKSR